MAIAIVDYGMGNLRSVQNALRELEAACELVATPERLSAFDKILLPGVGAFSEAIACLNASGMASALHEAAAAGTPILGICLGMQLMCRTSFEDGEHQGLGWFEAQVVPFRPEPGLKVPHMGWNSLSFTRTEPLTKGLPEGGDVYFVHSYHVACTDPADVIATSRHGHEFTAIMAKGNLYGVQFHPEKSQRIGLQLLSNFVSA